MGEAEEAGGGGRGIEPGASWALVAPALTARAWAVAAAALAWVVVVVVVVEGDGKRRWEE